MGELKQPPDVVTFSKKMLSGGFYYTDELKPTEGYRIYNTWVGDPSKLILLEQVIDEIFTKHLLDNVIDTGKILLKGLEDLQTQHPGMLQNARGLGSLVAVDMSSTALRDKIMGRLRNYGVHTGGCGTATLRLRPSLLFKQLHANIFLETLSRVLNELK